MQQHHEHFTDRFDAVESGADQRTLNVGPVAGTPPLAPPAPAPAPGDTRRKEHGEHVLFVPDPAAGVGGARHHAPAPKQVENAFATQFGDAILGAIEAANPENSARIAVSDARAVASGR